MISRHVGRMSEAYCADDPSAPNRRLELQAGADPTTSFVAASGGDGAVAHKPRPRGKAVGDVEANGALPLEEAPRHPDGRPARSDRGREPVGRHCNRDAATSFGLVGADLRLQEVNPLL